MKSPSSAGRIKSDDNAIRIGLEAVKQPLIKDFGMKPAKPALKAAKMPKDENRIMPEPVMPSSKKKMIPKRKK